MGESHPRPEGGSEDGPRSKRQRISLACDPCRARKTRCDGTRPSCGVCLDMDFDCHYQRPARSYTASAQDKEHIVRLEDRLQSMERTLQAMIGKINPSADPQNDSANTSTPAQPPMTANTPKSNVVGELLSHELPNVLVDSIYADGSDMRVQAALQDDTVDGMGVITFADELTSAYFGPTSNSAFFSHIAAAVPYTTVTDPQNIRSVMASDQANVNYISRPPSPPPDSNSSLQQLSVDDVYALPSKARIIHLVNLFFTEIGMTFPYIYKRWILDGLAEMKLTHFYGVRRSWLCLLNTIMAFATCLPAMLSEPGEKRGIEADIFLQRALKLLPNNSLKPVTLETFQALLLMTQYLQGTQRSAQTWNLQRLSVQAAFQLGVHSSTDSSKYSPLEQEIRKRSWYMCFILDKTCSMTFGRPPTIPNSYVLLEMPLDVDLEELDEVSAETSMMPSLQQNPKSRSTVIVYIQSIKLYHLIGDIVDEIYQNNIETNTSLSDIELFRRVISIEQKLNTWRLELPPNLQVKSKVDIVHDLNNSPKFSHLSAVITLRYLNARILLHRAVITRFLDYDGNKPNSASEWTFLGQFGKPSLEVSVSSAFELIDIIHSLSECQHRMHTTWWFLVYYAFSSALVVFSAIIIKRKHGVILSSYEHQDLLLSLQHALKALQIFGNGTQMANRCQKYLKKLIQHAIVFSMANNLSLEAPNDQTHAVLGMATPAGGLSELSPLDFDIEPFMLGYGYGWDGVFQPPF